MAENRGLQCRVNDTFLTPQPLDVGVKGERKTIKKSHCSTESKAEEEDTPSSSKGQFFRTEKEICDKRELGLGVGNPSTFAR